MPEIRVDVSPEVSPEWVDTRKVQFDATVFFSPAVDWEGWEEHRRELHTPDGSWAVWRSGWLTEKWSLYGGPMGTMAYDAFGSEAEARAEAERLAGVQRRASLSDKAGEPSGSVAR